MNDNSILSQNALFLNFNDKEQLIKFKLRQEYSDKPYIHVASRPQPLN